MPKFDLIGFDADDTLWQNERYYQAAQARFVQLLSNYHPKDRVRQRLYQTESRNIQHFGYGIKAFALSMIETAVELTEGRVSGHDISKLIELAREMLNARVELLEHVGQAIPVLADSYPLALITKGDLLDQQNKIARSELGPYFKEVEIVSQKTPEVYAALLKRISVEPVCFMMIGNSLKSDILPVLELGGSAVYIPHELTWEHEAAEQPAEGTPRYYSLTDMGQLPGLLEKLENNQ